MTNDYQTLDKKITIPADMMQEAIAVKDVYSDIALNVASQMNYCHKNGIQVPISHDETLVVVNAPEKKFEFLSALTEALDREERQKYRGDRDRFFKVFGVDDKILETVEVRSKAQQFQPSDSYMTGYATLSVDYVGGSAAGRKFELADKLDIGKIGLPQMTVTSNLSQNEIKKRMQLDIQYPDTKLLLAGMQSLAKLREIYATAIARGVEGVKVNMSAYQGLAK
jgi:hypothetical protein